jgi:hypothetical protein
MVRQDEKTLIFTIVSPRHEDFFLEWLVSLRTLGDYHGAVMALDYGISDRTGLLATRLGARLHRCRMPEEERTIVDYRFVDMMPILTQHYRQYKLAHFDVDIWFTSEVSELFQEVDEVPGCLFATECRTSLLSGGRGPQDTQAVARNAAKVEQVVRHCRGHINGGFVAGRYQPFVDKLTAMRTAFAQEWEIGRVNQYLINVLFDLDRDRANGHRWNCSLREAFRKDGAFYHLKNSDMSFRNGQWMLDKIQVERVVGLHLNLAGIKTERFSKFHPGLFRRTISDVQKQAG